MPSERERREPCWKITYRFKDQFGWKIGYMIIHADSKEEAIRKADKWPPLILNVDQL